ncbi:MAG TPA: hypothetical protein VJ911_05170 [Cryomorphaceae bacterium]|nr:hypothetical protein [Cryomorphaceae bacterium]
MKLLQKVKSHLANLPGWRTKRKIVVFESDDWGAQRMPSRKAYEAMVGKGLGVEQSKYDQFDSLERKEDLEALADVLQKFKDSRGNSPVFTTNMVLGNPDFDAIEEKDFQQYAFESFYESYEKYYGQSLEQTWSRGIADGFFYPQFHAREHLNVPLWMKDLKDGNKSTRLAFSHRFLGLKTKTSSLYQKNYLAAYRAENPLEFTQMMEIAKDGFKLFEKTFGFPSKTFIACNYIWPKAMEEALLPAGVKVFQSQRAQLDPQFQKGGKLKIRRKFTGQRNSYRQLFTVRNVRFEPYLRNSATKEVNSAFSEIQRSFFWKKPAIISSHRINYVGNMSESHRSENMEALHTLLTKIKKNYPEVEFMNSAKLAEIVAKS